MSGVATDLPPAVRQRLDRRGHAVEVGHRRRGRPRCSRRGTYTSRRTIERPTAGTSASGQPVASTRFPAGAVFAQRSFTSITPSLSASLWIGQPFGVHLRAGRGVGAPIEVIGHTVTVAVDRAAVAACPAGYTGRALAGVFGQRSPSSVTPSLSVSRGQPLASTGDAGCGIRATVEVVGHLSLSVSTGQPAFAASVAGETGRALAGVAAQRS